LPARLAFAHIATNDQIKNMGEGFNNLIRMVITTPAPPRAVPT
jgi:hypothetical protein